MQTNWLAEIEDFPVAVLAGRPPSRFDGEGDDTGGDDGDKGGDDKGGSNGAVDWREGLSDDDKTLLETKGYDNPGKLVSAYRNAESIIGVPQERLLRLPGDDETSDAWNSVYEKLGVPAEADGYDLPDLADGVAANEDTDKYLREQAKALDLRPVQFAELRARHYAGEAQLAQAVEQRINEGTEKVERALITKLGQAGYKEHQALTRKAFSFLAEGSDEDKLWGRLERAGFTSDQAFMERMALMGRSLSEDGDLGDGDPGRADNSIAGLKARITALKADEDFKKKFLNEDHPQHADAIRELTALNEKLAEAEGRNQTLGSPLQEQVLS